MFLFQTFFFLNITIERLHREQTPHFSKESGPNGDVALELGIRNGVGDSCPFRSARFAGIMNTGGA
ncbi:hypothetical protein IF1G_06846 [Cordyceps javanica]|uniref:Uncharacterized protein n=1 Tax=Cordyceps javanica TaxID=43265 RepID=A0A545UZE2_9HYPO|nr:hypothetical protein IF1G_06846 [Cordyceps javanica]